MTAPQKHAIKVGVITALLGASLIAAAQQVILRPEYALHVQQEEAVMQRVLDVVCTDHPSHRSCK